MTVAGRALGLWLMAVLPGCSRREAPHHETPIKAIDATELVRPSAVPSAPLPLPAPPSISAPTAPPHDDGTPKPVTLTWVLYDQTTDQQKTMIEAVVRSSPTEVQRKVVGTTDWGVCAIPESSREVKNPIAVGSAISQVACRYGGDLAFAEAIRTAPDELTLRWRPATALEPQGEAPTPPEVVATMKIPTGAVFTVKQTDIAKKK